MRQSSNPGIPHASAPAPPLAHRVLGSPLIAVAAGAAMMLMIGWRFLHDPTLLAPTRDPAWYTWRTQLLLEDDPRLLITKQGPFTALSGGYRVVSPLVGALLHRVAGVHPWTYTKLLMVGLPVMTAMALGWFALRHRRDPLTYLLTLLVAVGMYLTTPFIGYLDNVMALYLLAISLPFLDLARTSWGARSAVGLMVFLTTLTHPTTAAAFTAVLAVAMAVRWPTTRFSVRKVLATDGPMVGAASVGLLLGCGVWIVGLWGAASPVTDAVLTQPYPDAYFRTRLDQFLHSLRWDLLRPLLAAAGVWLVIRAVRHRQIDEASRVSIVWLLPLIGMFGFVLGLNYPYYRFLNATLGLVLLAGTGAWALTRLLLWAGPRVGDRWGILQVLGAVLIVFAVATTYYGPGLRRLARESEWIGRTTRSTMAGVRAYIDSEPEHPVVLVIKPRPDLIRAWGLAKQFIDIQFGGLAGDQVRRTYVYAGDVSAFLQDRPTVTGNPVFDRVSRGYLADVRAGLAADPRPPIVLYLRHFNRGLGDAEAAAVEITATIELITGPGLAPPDEAGAEAARRAQRADALALEAPVGRLSEPWHIVRVVIGLVILLLLPGTIARRWFGIDRMVGWVSVVPGLSLGLTLFASILVVAARRAPFDELSAWASVGVANLLAVGLAVVAPLVSRAPPPAELPPSPALNGPPQPAETF